MTSKERAEFRSAANNLTPACQIGKNGITDGLLKQVDQELTAHELIKIKVLLESTPVAPKDAGAQLASATGAELISVIGGVITLYRYSPELHEKQARKAANKKRAERIAREKQRAKNGPKRGRSRR